jgi:hypothetical protein
MSCSDFIFRDVPMGAWLDRYEKSHQNPINRVFHTFGIPIIAVSRGRMAYEAYLTTTIQGAREARKSIAEWLRNQEAGEK